MSTSQLDYRELCISLLQAESESEVTTLLEENALLDSEHWKPLGDMPNNRSMVDNQQQDPAGALVEKIINGVDAMLTKECFLHGIAPDSPPAPSTMYTAAEEFFRISEGDLANLTSRELTGLAENIQLVATGSKTNPCYLVIDKGEGQTPSRFEETFLSLVRNNKAKIPFVQGKFNCGGTGVLPFCGREAYQLILSRRCPEIPSGPDSNGSKDQTHSLWGFTLIRRLLASAGVYDTSVYVYLAPNGETPCFEANELLVLPDVKRESVGEEPKTEESTVSSQRDGTPPPYRLGLVYGTVVKLYNYEWPARSLATTDARFALEEYLHKLCLPFRITETRQGYKAHYFATTVAGTAPIITRDKDKGYLEANFPASGEIHPEGVGELPTSIVVYREKIGSQDKTAKDPHRLPKGLRFTINGQVHLSIGTQFFISRGLRYDYIRRTLLVTVDCTGLPEDIREILIMPSRDRLRRVPEYEAILQSIVADLKDRDSLRAINDERRLRKVQQALNQEAAQNVLQSIIDKDPVFASLFKNGRGLRDPYRPGPEPTPPYQGKLPPTFFHFRGGKTEITKSFPIDRTCRIELETDAVNDYFDLPDPRDRGQLTIDPPCWERWNLWNGRLSIVLRAPSDAKVGDTLGVNIAITDPCLEVGGNPPWATKVTLEFTEGGKPVSSGSRERKLRESQAVGLPNIVEVRRDRWDEYGFDERAGLSIRKGDNESWDMFINMDNKYLLNELMQRKEPDKEAAKFAYKWGLVLVALGMLQEATRHVEREDEEQIGEQVEEQVSRLSTGVAAVIIPTVLNLMESMKEETEAAIA